MIDSQNWTFCQYNSSNLKAFVSLSGEPTEDGDSVFLYNVTVTDQEDLEIFQSDHPSLDQAIDIINNKYGHWNFTNLTVQSGNESGCGSCSAH